MVPLEKPYVAKRNIMPGRTTPTTALDQGIRNIPDCSKRASNIPGVACGCWRFWRFRLRICSLGCQHRHGIISKRSSRNGWFLFGFPLKHPPKKAALKRGGQAHMCVASTKAFPETTGFSCAQVGWVAGYLNMLQPRYHALIATSNTTAEGKADVAESDSVSESELPAHSWLCLSKGR